MSTTPADPIHVLHVDDDSEFVELAATFVENEEEFFDVETATSDSDGLEQLTDSNARNGNTDEVDCIVSDYDMPTMSGLVFLKIVRKKYPELPFVMFTENPIRRSRARRLLLAHVNS